MTDINEKIAWLKGMQKDGHKKIAIADITRNELEERLDFQKFLDDNFGRWRESDAVDEAREAFTDSAWDSIADRVEDYLWEAIDNFMIDAVYDAWADALTDMRTLEDNPLAKELKSRKRKLVQELYGEEVDIDNDTADAFITLKGMSKND